VVLSREGGIEIERELPTLYTVRDGLTVRIDGFIDRADAFEAAGLQEDRQDDSPSGAAPPSPASRGLRLSEARAGGRDWSARTSR